jgi:hypothetical protein
MFIIPLQCRIFEQRSEHFQQITLLYKCWIRNRSEGTDITYFVPPFVVSRTRDPDPPVFRVVPLTFVVSRTRDPDPLVFRAVPLALHLISHSLRNKRSWSMTERPYCIRILNSYGLRNDRSRSRLAPVDYLDFLSAPVVGTVGTAKDVLIL